MADAKPCPFCGSTSLGIRYEGQPAQKYALICADCGGTTRSVLCGGSGSGSRPTFDNPDALAAWNRRATDGVPANSETSFDGSNSRQQNLSGSATYVDFSIQEADARRGRYVVETAEWRRNDGRTYLMVRVPDGSDLSCIAMRENALDSAIAGVPLPVEAHWRCLTCGGTTASPLTDESRCKCADIYDQQWVRESGPAGNAGVQEKRNG